MSTTKERPPFLTVDEFAELARVSPQTVYRLIHAGKVPSVRVGDQYRIPASALEIDDREEPAA